MGEATDQCQGHLSGEVIPLLSIGEIIMTYLIQNPHIQEIVTDNQVIIYSLLCNWEVYWDLSRI